MINLEFIKDNQIKSQAEITVLIDGQEIQNPTLKQIANDGWKLYHKNEYNIDKIRGKILYKLSNYDRSSEVNSFYVGNIETWITRDTRISLMNSTQILKNVGQETTTLWLNNTPYTLACDQLIQMLHQLEVYALQCYNVTAQHKANIDNITNIEDLKNYDYKIGYPEKLTFNIN